MPIKLGLIVGAFLITTAMSVALLSVRGLPYSPLSSVSTDNPYVQPTVVKLVFIRQPGDAEPGKKFGIQPVVEVQDDQGNRLTGDKTTRVTVSLTPDTGTPGASLSGANRKKVKGGLAVFPNLRIDRAGDDYQLTATAPGLEAATSESFDVTDSEPPTAPRLKEPRPNEELDDEVQFQWKQSRGDVFAYVLQVTSGDIITGPYDINVRIEAKKEENGEETQFQIDDLLPLSKLKDSDPDTQFEPENPLPLGTYRWRVIAEDTAGNRAISEVRTFFVGEEQEGDERDLTPPGPPRLEQPEDNDIVDDSKVQFQWKSAKGDVKDYVLQVAIGDIETGPYVINEVLPADETEFEAALPDGAYEWRVIARDAAGNPTISKVFSFTADTAGKLKDLGKPDLEKPDEDEYLLTDTPLFRWQTEGVFTDFTLQVASGNIKRGPYDIDVVVLHPTTEYQTQANESLEDGKYRWRVVARDALGNQAFSDTETFFVNTALGGAIALAEPEDAAFLDKTPNFQWETSSEDVEQFRLEVTSGDISLGPFDVNVVLSGDQEEFKPTIVLADAVYVWRVTSTGSGLNTASSVTRTFTMNTGPAGALVLSDPERNAVLVTGRPEFEWEDPGGNVRDYRLQVVRSGDNVETGPYAINVVIRSEEEGQDAETEYEPSREEELAKGAYRWRVIATDALGSKAFSRLRSFTVETIVIEQYLVTVKSVEVNKHVTAVGSAWVTAVTGPITFDIAELIAGGGTPSFLGSAVAEPGTYKAIRMTLESVQLKLEGVPTLVTAEIGDALKISKCFLPDGKKRGGSICFEVVEGKVTRFLIDLKSGSSLIKPDEGKFVFKPKLVIRVLLEGGVPPVNGKPASTSPQDSVIGTAAISKADGSTFIPAQAGGTIEVVVSDTAAAAPTPNVEGKVLLQGRAAGDHAGTVITLFRNGVPVQTGATTQASGFFSLLLGTGDYTLQATHPGWLPEARTFVIDVPAATGDLGTINLLAGDADADDGIDSRDLRLFAQALGRPPSPGTHTDINNDGIVDVFDLAYAALNFTLPLPQQPP